MIKQYRKKPVVIEAIQWTGENIQECFEFVGNKMATQKTKYFSSSGEPFEQTDIVIFSLEGAMSASIGDYLIKGVEGEFYPCKPDIFERTYEEV